MALVRSRKCTQISEKSFHTGESKQNASELFPAVGTISNEPQASKVWRESLQNGPVMFRKILWLLGSCVI